MIWFVSWLAWWPMLFDMITLTALDSFFPRRLAHLFLIHCVTSMHRYHVLSWERSRFFFILFLLNNFIVYFIIVIKLSAIASMWRVSCSKRNNCQRFFFPHWDNNYLFLTGVFYFYTTIDSANKTGWEKKEKKTARVAPVNVRVCGCVRCVAWKMRNARVQKFGPVLTVEFSAG